MFSLRRLKERKSPAPFGGYDWIMDSGAFSEINLNGKYTFTPEEYLHYVELHQPNLFFNMDFMCEPFVLQKTGLTGELPYPFGLGFLRVCRSLLFREHFSCQATYPQ